MDSEARAMSTVLELSSLNCIPVVGILGSRMERKMPK